MQFFDIAKINFLSFRSFLSNNFFKNDFVTETLPLSLLTLLMGMLRYSQNQKINFLLVRSNNECLSLLKWWNFRQVANLYIYIYLILMNERNAGRGKLIIPFEISRQSIAISSGSLIYLSFFLFGEHGWRHFLASCKVFRVASNE